jgi:hypothetical protein
LFLQFFDKLTRPVNQKSRVRGARQIRERRLTPLVRWSETVERGTKQMGFLLPVPNKTP